MQWILVREGGVSSNVCAGTRHDGLLSVASMQEICCCIAQGDQPCQDMANLTLACHVHLSLVLVGGIALSTLPHQYTDKSRMQLQINIALTRQWRDKLLESLDDFS